MPIKFSFFTQDGSIPHEGAIHKEVLILKVKNE